MRKNEAIESLIKFSPSLAVGCIIIVFLLSFSIWSLIPALLAAYFVWVTVLNRKIINQFYFHGGEEELRRFNDEQSQKEEEMKTTCPSPEHDIKLLIFLFDKSDPWDRLDRLPLFYIDFFDHICYYYNISI